MNSMLMRLKIAQTRGPVYPGMILCKASLKPLTIQNLNDLEKQHPLSTRTDYFSAPKDKQELSQISDVDSLNYASKKADLFRVRSVSRLVSRKAGKDHETYKMALQPVVWDAAKADFVTSSQSPHPFDISISSEELNEHFGLISKEVAHKAISGEVSKKVKHLLDSYNHDLYDASVDYDKILKSIFHKITLPYKNSLSKEDKEDLFSDALIHATSHETLDKFDKEKGSLVAFIYSRFKFELMDGIRNMMSGERGFETEESSIPSGVEEGEESDSSSLDLIKFKSDPSSVEDQNPENIVSFSHLLETFKEYLSKKHWGDTLNKIVDELQMGGIKRQELADKFGIHPSRISHFLTMIKEGLEDFAEETDNDFLYSMIERMSKNKHKSADDAEKKEKAESLIDELEGIFKTYREITSSKEEKSEEVSEGSKERFPTGKQVKFKKKELPSSLDDLKGKMALDDSKSKEAAEKEMDEYLAQITSMDDILEEDGKVIGLKVYNTL